MLVCAMPSSGVEQVPTFVAASMLLSASTKRTCPATMISPRVMLRQSRPAKRDSSLRATGGLLIKSWIACCDKEAWRWRGELGMPRSLNDWRCDMSRLTDRGDCGNWSFSDGKGELLCSMAVTKMKR